jgi:hypothetical protein
VSAIPPPERFWKLEDGRWEIESRKRFCRAKVLSFKFLGFPFSPRRWTEQSSGFGLVFDPRSSAFGSLRPIHDRPVAVFFRHGIIEPCLRFGMS